MPPEALMLEIVIETLPLFVRVTLSELVVPSFTFPKLKVVGLADRS